MSTSSQVALGRSPFSTESQQIVTTDSEIPDAGFDSLPPEMLVKIFVKWDAVQRVQLQRVCHRWHSLLASPIQRDVRITDPNRFLALFQGSSYGSHNPLQTHLGRMMGPTTRCLTVQGPSSCLDNPTRLLHALALGKISAVCPSLSRLTFTDGWVTVSLFDRVPASVQTITLRNVKVAHITAIHPMIYCHDVNIADTVTVMRKEPGLGGFKAAFFEVVERYAPRLSAEGISQLAGRILAVTNWNTIARIDRIVKTRERDFIPSELPKLKNVTLWELHTFLFGHNAPLI
ncbi:hypothetical protein BV898_10512 [Hypsibius exemplaris]|uniref:F-box domain-containing protein n=1 Tax=Hypsibius exemplaris TaxID=2072580 RepID=A0A1W0WJ81_HYPEX|nr:hypothetical protein BV898_10512 [Hypsibius exemplaris]